MTYVPDTDFVGTDTFEYTVCDSKGNCDTATVTVDCGLPALDVVDDTASTPEDTMVDIDILANDSGIPTDGTLTYTDPANGTVTRNDNGTPNDLKDDSVIYTPDTGYNGTDTFEYTVCNNVGTCDTATVTVEVGTPPAPPVLYLADDTASTPEDTAVDIDILANDTGIPKDGTLNHTDPTNGTVIVNDNGTPDDITDDTVTYTPNAGYNGTDTFEYTVCDTLGTCDTASVTITVGTLPALDVVDDTATTPEGTGVDIDILANDIGIPADGTLTYTDPAHGTVSINDNGTPELTDDSVIYTPNAGYNGVDTFEYTVCDSSNTCDTATVTVNVGTMTILVAVDDDYSDNPVDATAGGVVDGSNVYSNDTWNGDPLNPEDVVLTSTPTGPLTVNTDGTVTVAPNSAVGTYTIEYTICEKLHPDNCDTATVTVKVDDLEVDILINQMVTPNGDGKNDFLYIRGIRNFPKNSLQIYNRWGVLVYEGTGYNNQNNVFDGYSKGRSTINSKESLPASVYYYIFNYEKNMQNITLNGYIYVSK